MPVRKGIKDILAFFKGRPEEDFVRDHIERERQKPLTAAIFGQTGTGKSSLTNALFGTNFKVDDVRPCTKEPQRYDGIDSAGNPVTFWDLPGIGESAQTDLRYLDMYTSIASTCDVILWAFQADTRSIAVDAGALRAIAERLTEEDRVSFLSRISVVLTKADTINVDPWIIARDGNKAIVAAGDESTRVLDEKSRYFHSGLFSHFGDDMVTRTYVTKNNFNNEHIPEELWMDDDKRFVHFRGSIKELDIKSLLQKYPDWGDELTRLSEGSKAVACSARLNFNLNEIKALIAEKANGASYVRLGNVLRAGESTIPWSNVRNLGFPVIYDIRSEKKIFDAEEL